jgi:LPXTG-site transpeptidase (sortase) family protein
LKKILGFAGIVLGTVLLFYTFIHATLYTGPQIDYGPASVGGLKENASSGLKKEELIPQRIEIPSINVDAKVQQVGTNAKGNVGVPTNFTDVAWYKYGPAPGEAGSAIMDGHVDNALALPGVFKYLENVKKGDSIFVYTTSGKKLEFKVTDVKSYVYDEVPVNLVFNDFRGAHLNLITCDGAWVQKNKNYDHRLVVYSDLITS